MKDVTLETNDSDQARAYLRQALSLSINLGFQVANFYRYTGEVTGFSFTVATEFQAYKAAYIYRRGKYVEVAEAPNVDAWIVRVFDKERK